MTSWHSNKFLNPIRDGAVLPALHLNGYKIANPTILARIPHEELEALLTGYGHKQRGYWKDETETGASVGETLLAASPDGSTFLRKTIAVFW